MGLLPFSACAAPSPPPFLLFAMSRSLKRTIVLDVSGFPDDCPINSIASKICEEFSDGDVLSVQFMPSRSVRVTFKDESIKFAVLNNECLSVDSVQCPVRGGGPRPENVLVFRYPFEAELSALKDVMSHYGVVHDIHRRSWLHLNNVADGSVVVRMTRSHPVPRTVNVNDYYCKAWYKGMPMKCDICEGSHKAQDCPYKGLCMRCRQPGHVQRDCTNAPNAWGTASTVPTPAEVHTVPTIVPDAGAPPVSASAASSAPVVPCSDSPKVVTEVVDAGGGSEPIGSPPQSVLSSDSIDSFPSPESGVAASGVSLWSDLSPDIVDAVVSQPADAFGGSVEIEIDNDVNNTSVNNSADYGTYDETNNSNKSIDNGIDNDIDYEVDMGIDIETNNDTDNETNKCIDNGLSNDSVNETSKHIKVNKSKVTNNSSGGKKLNKKKAPKLKTKTGRVSPHVDPGYKSGCHVPPSLAKAALACHKPPTQRK